MKKTILLFFFICILFSLSSCENFFGDNGQKNNPSRYTTYEENPLYKVTDDLLK